VVPQFSTAEVQVHPSGKLRVRLEPHAGLDRGVRRSIAATGKLTLVGHQSEGVKGTPRNFGVDPTGKFAVVCNQAGDDGNLVFAIDPQTGALWRRQREHGSRSARRCA
jgi:6-phosphogluconolactonase